ncbi:MAG: hypothetical protein U0667_03485 [Chloroflexota bacterium]
MSAIGDAATRRATVRTLGRAMPFVRHQLGCSGSSELRAARPREDDSAERGTRLLQILDELDQGETVDEVAADAPLALPAPAPIRGVPEPRPKRPKHQAGRRGGQRGH